MIARLKRPPWRLALILLPVLIVIVVGFIAAFRHQHLQALNNNKTYTAMYNRPITFVGEQSSENIQKFYYAKEYGFIHDWYIQDSKKVKKDSPIFEYYNKDSEQQLTVIRKQLSALDKNKQSSNYKTLHAYLEQQYYLIQTKLRMKQYSTQNGVLHILNAQPSKPGQLFAVIYSNKKIIKATVSEKLRNQLKVNQIVDIKNDFTQPFKGKIMKISPFPNEEAQTKSTSEYDVVISTNETIPVGMHFDISITTHIMALPKSVLFDNHSVLIQKNQKAVKRIIKYKEKEGMVLISEGLLPGDKVIAYPKNFTIN